MKWVMRIILVVAAISTLIWVYRKVVISEQTRIERQILAMKRAVETGQILKLNNAIATGYSDDRGFDKRTVLGFIGSVRRQYDVILIRISNQDIELAPDRLSAKVRLKAQVLSVSVGSLAETDLYTDRFELEFRKMRGDWLLYRVESPGGGRRPF